MPLKNSDVSARNGAPADSIALSAPPKCAANCRRTTRPTVANHSRAPTEGRPPRATCRPSRSVTANSFRATAPFRASPVSIRCCITSQNRGTTISTVGAASRNSRAKCSGPRDTKISPPRAIGEMKPAVCSYVCESGRNDRKRFPSSPYAVRFRAAPMQFHSTLRCVCSTPFGVPPVPDV